MRHLFSAVVEPWLLTSGGRCVLSSWRVTRRQSRRRALCCTDVSFVKCPRTVKIFADDGIIRLPRRWALQLTISIMWTSCTPLYHHWQLCSGTIYVNELFHEILTLTLTNDKTLKEFPISNGTQGDAMNRVHSKLKGQNSRTFQGPKIAVFKYQKYQ